MANRPWGVQNSRDGGLRGYSLGIWIRPWYSPPSQGQALKFRSRKCHQKMLVGDGTIKNASFGCFSSVSFSFMSRRMVILEAIQLNSAYKYKYCIMQGNNVVAQAFAQQRVSTCFGVIGVPVIELGYALQGAGIDYYGFRNEQAASYGASAIGYLTQRPAICLVVSGPGLVHALAGAANAQVNGWPLVIVAGASDLGLTGSGAFQEYDQLSIVKPYVKFAARITDLRFAPQVIEQAVRISMVGRPGCTYIEVPGDILRQKVDEQHLTFPAPFETSSIPKSLAAASNVQQSLDLLRTAKSPLVIIGKGCAMSRAEPAVNAFINKSGLPFLPTPMGKGVVPDSHPNNVSPARSTALGQADVVLLLGARLNWILHFGKAPRFRPDVKIIHVDLNAEEFDNNVRSSVNLLGDITSIVQQLNQGLSAPQWKYDSGSQWWSTLRKKIQVNIANNEELINDKELPLQYYSSIGIIAKYLPKDAIIIGEGSNTMDIGRTIISHEFPRSKLDSGTFATMGVGMGFCIAAKIANPSKQVIAVVGDSAFGILSTKTLGFSAMEFETATRYNLPVVVIVINNNGIFMGVDEINQQSKNSDIPVTALNPTTAYDKLVQRNPFILQGEAFGAKGFLVNTHEELHEAMKEVVANPKKSYLLNVKISPLGQKKPQEHSWLTQSKL